MKTYRPWNPEQSHLLPPSPTEWLPDGHLVHFILDVIKELDLSAITRAVDAKDARGERPYSPVMMTALLLYAYSVGVFSSRRIERATYEDVAFRVLCAGQHPYFTRIAEFRRKHLDAFEDIFVQTVRLCQQAGMVKLGLVAIDGTKMQGNASKHKAMSYERMKEKEERLQAEVTELLARAEAADRAEDERFGEGQRQEDLPAELRRREDRLEKIRAAKRALEHEALVSRAQKVSAQASAQERSAEDHDDPAQRKRAATRARKLREEVRELAERMDDDDPPPSHTGTTSSGLDTHRAKSKPDGTPHPKSQYNFTDAQSRIQESGGTFLQGYNCQAMVDAEAQVIVAAGVTNLQPDNSHMQPMLAQTKANAGRLPEALAADAGYWLASNVDYCDERGVDVYIATRRRRRGGASPPDSAGTTAARECMEQKLATAAGRKLYAKRKTTVEPVFGQIKEARGFRRFLLRGLRKVTGEWSMLTATHNLLKLHRRMVTATP